jgi:O-antigen/teichoic acid export membrane protein
MSGAALSQVLPMVLSPALTRVFTANEYGLFAIYAVILALLAPFAGLRFPLSIVKAKSETEAANLFLLSLAISIAVAATTFIVWTFFISFNFMQYFEIKTSPPKTWGLYLAISIFEVATIDTATHWLNRQRHYSSLSTLRVAQACFVVVSQLLFGVLFSSGDALIMGTLVGQMIAIYLVGRRHLSDLVFIRNAVTLRGMFDAAVSHIDNPRYLLPASLLESASSNAPVMLLSYLTSTSVVGNFNLTKRVLGLPTSIITGAVAQVFFRDMSELYLSGKLDELRFTVIRAWSIFCLVGFVPATIIIVWGESLFAVVFGQHWALAGKMSEILMLAFYAQFISATTNSGFIIMGLQKYNLLSGVVTVVLRPAALFIGLQFGVLGGIWAFSITEVGLILWYNWLLLNCLRRIK